MCHIPMTEGLCHCGNHDVAGACNMRRAIPKRKLYKGCKWLQIQDINMSCHMILVMDVELSTAGITDEAQQTAACTLHRQSPSPYIISISGHEHICHNDSKKKHNVC